MQLSEKYMDIKVANNAAKLTGNLFEIVEDWNYGDTSLHNELWMKHFIPKSKQALTNARKGRYDLSMQSLLGMLTFFMHYGPFWLHDQEIYMEEDEFCSFFSNTSDAWKILFSKSDDELKLKENCRDSLKQVVMKLQHDVNNISDDLFGDLDDNARLSIFSDDEMEEYEDEDEDEEDEDEDEEDK